MSLPYCSHNGFFSQCYNDIHKRVSKKVLGQNASLAGHLQYLQAVGAKQDAKHLKGLFESMRREAEDHYCLPDNVMQHMTEEDRQSYDGERTYVHLPARTFTLSHQRRGLCELFLFTPADDGTNDLLVFPMNLVQLTHFIDHGLLTREQAEEAMALKSPDALTKALGRYLSPLQVATMASWVSNTIAGRIPQGGWPEVYDWSLELLDIKGRNTHPTQRQAAAERLFEVMACFGALLARPTEYRQFEYDPDYVPKKASYTAKRKNKHLMDEVKPRKIRRYVPKRVYEASDAPLATPGPSTGSKQMEHRRKRHKRTYKNGRTIWIDSYVAGDPALGSRVKVADTIELIPRRS